jgi:ribonuclease-3
LAQRLGHDFANVQLLRLALVHRSAFAEEQLDESNERLEFLGDSVLGLVITDALYRRRSEQAEGRLARARAELVDETTLAEAARRIDVGSALRLGRGEDTSGGRDKASILADATEALIGAVYLDGGFEAARRVVTGLLEPVFDQRLGLADPKSHLQELAAARGLGEPRYHTESSGPDHRKQFSTTVEVSDRRFGPGTGHSKRQSEQAAAGLALGALETPE